jgi:HEAT repeat protein
VSAKGTTAPSPALTEAVLARWPKDAGFVANAVVTWRLRAAAPLVAKTLTTSGDGMERAFGAMALGGTGDLTYLPLLRQVASSDAEGWARALAYNGIMYMLGPDSLSDLRRGAKDSDEKVRAQSVVDSYNLLELERPDRHWPPASNTLIAEVRAFLIEMQADPARLVSDNAKSMLAMIAQRRP